MVMFIKFGAIMKRYT